MSFNSFYPISETMQSAPHGMWQLHMVLKLETHLSNAQSGDRDAESRLVNRIGQLRRNASTVEALCDNLRDVIRKAIAWLESIGRTVNLQHADPAYWITQRGGAPRW